MNSDKEHLLDTRPNGAPVESDTPMVDDLVAMQGGAATFNEAIRQYNELSLLARRLERKNAELREALSDLLDQVESLNGYELTRDIEPYKAEACWRGAQENASRALKD